MIVDGPAAAKGVALPLIVLVDALAEAGLAPVLTALPSQRLAWHRYTLGRFIIYESEILLTRSLMTWAQYQCCGSGASGAATFCWSQSRSFFVPAPAPEPGIKILKKCYKNPKFFILKFEVDFKNHNFVCYLL
jgi:hypothetical protein